MANWFNISCKQATYLISKKQDKGMLTVGQKLQLFIHLFICDMCKLFKIQTNYFLKNIHQNRNQEELSIAAKEKMVTKINDAIDNNL